MTAALPGSDAATACTSTLSARADPAAQTAHRHDNCSSLAVLEDSATQTPSIPSCRRDDARGLTPRLVGKPAPVVICIVATCFRLQPITDDGVAVRIFDADFVALAAAG